MNGAALLAHQLRVVHLVAAQNLEGMSAEDALLQPPGGGNCANWILGHLVNVHNDLAGVLGVEPVWEDPRLARAGAEPITTPDEAIDWEALVARFAAGEARIAEALGALTEDDLAAVIPTPAFGDTPRGIFLATVLFHQAYHAGQLATARRLAGHPGAIRIPGTEQGGPEA
jgi:uncharacterized damage-inducible protein DinB